MLELRPVCENCGKELPNESDEAFICSFECTFCAHCVEEVLFNVCPNCGGGFEKRPSRPVECITPNCLDHFPATKARKIRPVDMEKLKDLQAHYMHTDPRKR